MLKILFSCAKSNTIIIVGYIFCFFSCQLGVPIVTYFGTRCFLHISFNRWIYNYSTMYNSLSNNKNLRYFPFQMPKFSLRVATPHRQDSNAQNVYKWPVLSFNNSVL